MAYSHRQAVDRIALRLPFGSGATTYRGYLPTLRGDFNEEGDYVIFSYGAHIATIARDGSTWVTESKYSNTTSRHTGIARRGIHLYLVGQEGSQR